MSAVITSRELAASAAAVAEVALQQGAILKLTSVVNTLFIFFFSSCCCCYSLLCSSLHAITLRQFNVRAVSALHLMFDVVLKTHRRFGTIFS
jgi:hypothetical protein